jgi:hypothetical protein
MPMVIYCIVLYCIVLYCIVLYCIVLLYAQDLPSFLLGCLWFAKGEIEDVDHLLSLGPHLSGKAKPGHYVRCVLSRFWYHLRHKCVLTSY